MTQKTSRTRPKSQNSAIEVPANVDVFFFRFTSFLFILLDSVDKMTKAKTQLALRQILWTEKSTQIFLG